MFLLGMNEQYLQLSVPKMDFRQGISYQLFNEAILKKGAIKNFTQPFISTTFYFPIYEMCPIEIHLWSLKNYGDGN